jgi:hypothetical protein
MIPVTLVHQGEFLHTNTHDTIDYSCATAGIEPYGPEDTLEVQNLPVMSINPLRNRLSRIAVMASRTMKPEPDPKAQSLLIHVDHFRAKMRIPESTPLWAVLPFPKHAVAAILFGSPDLMKALDLTLHPKTRFGPELPLVPE